MSHKNPGAQRARDRERYLGIPVGGENAGRLPRAEWDKEKHMCPRCFETLKVRKSLDGDKWCPHPKLQAAKRPAPFYLKYTPEPVTV